MNKLPYSMCYMYSIFRYDLFELMFWYRHSFVKLSTLIHVLMNCVTVMANCMECSFKFKESRQKKNGESIGEKVLDKNIPAGHQTDQAGTQTILT